MSEHGALTAQEVLALAQIVNVAQRGGRVSRVCTTVFDGVVKGTARHIVSNPLTAGFAGSDDDIRDCWLRVTTTSGFEAYWPVKELVQEWEHCQFVVHED